MDLYSEDRKNSQNVTIRKQRSQLNGGKTDTWPKMIWMVDRYMKRCSTSWAIRESTWKETGRETKGQRDRETDTETQRQRETDTQRQRETERHTDILASGSNDRASSNCKVVWDVKQAVFLSNILKIFIPPIIEIIYNPIFLKISLLTNSYLNERTACSDLSKQSPLLPLTYSHVKLCHTWVPLWLLVSHAL